MGKSIIFVPWTIKVSNMVLFPGRPNCKTYKFQTFHTSVFLTTSCWENCWKHYPGWPWKTLSAWERIILYLYFFKIQLNGTVVSTRTLILMGLQQVLFQIWILLTAVMNVWWIQPQIVFIGHGMHRQEFAHFLMLKLIRWNLDTITMEKRNV